MEGEETIGKSLFLFCKVISPGNHFSFCHPGWSRDFGNFNEFRRAFWRAVANSSYRNEFSSSNITRMNQGTAPIVVKSQQYKGQKSYILHHRNPIHDGGDVYNLDNLIIVTPQMHQEILEKGYHFGK